MAYIADKSSVAGVDHGSVTPDEDDNASDTISSGIDFGELSTDRCGATDSNSDAVYCGNADSPAQKVPASTKTVSGTDNNWPFIQTYPFSGTIEIQYNKAGGTQITSLEFDDNADGLSLDRTNYPQGAQVHVTIGDHRLNIDPTKADVWTWNMANSTAMYYGDAVTSDDIVEAKRTHQVCAGCSLEIDFNGQSSTAIIEIAAVENRELPSPPVVEAEDAVAAVEDDINTDDINETVDAKDAVPAEAWFTVREIGGPNTAVFAATNLADESILTVVDDASRDSAAYITYDGDTADILVKHSEATIDIQSPDDVWTSGLAIPIVIVDGDTNKNSRDSDNVVLTDPSSIIPTLVTGDPFTLGEVSSDLTVWLGDWEVGSDQVALDLLNRNVKSNERLSTYGDGEDNPFILLGFKLNADGTMIIDDENVDNAVVLKNNAEVKVESFSDRAILKFKDMHGLTNMGDNPDTTRVNETNTDRADLISVATDITGNTTSLTGLDFIVIDFENGYPKLLDSLIDERTGATGYNFLNYNFESLKTNVASIQIVVDHDPVPSHNITLGNQKGYINVLGSDTDDGSMADWPLTGDFLQLRLNFDTPGLTVNADMGYPIVLDFLSFGFENNGEASDERIANQIIRLLLEESDDNTASLEGTLEYIMINQMNIDDLGTYQDLTIVGDEVSFIVIEDLTGSNAPSVTYLDVDTTGTQTQVSAQEDAPSHSAVVSLNVESFKAADTVTVTLEDLDLNVDSGLIDIYTVVSADAHPGDKNQDTVGEPYGAPSHDVELGRLLEITFDDKRWQTQVIDKSGTFVDTSCTNTLQANDIHTGLGSTGFRLVETGDATGIFVGTFSIPVEFCSENSIDPESVTGLDIGVNYVDFRDQSGETTEVGDSAGVKANTGSVSLDRTVYPVPFGVPNNFGEIRIDASTGEEEIERSTSTTPSQGNTKTRSLFPIHQSGMTDDTKTGFTDGLDPSEVLPQGDLIVYVTVTDPDFDISASGKDSIAVDPAPVTVSVLRGSESVEVARIGGSDSPIDEIAPDAGIFEKSVTLTYADGPGSSICPSTTLVDPYPGETGGNAGNNCILQGDILQVEYNDPTDASGQSNTVTDSATFDLRNGVLQSDKSVYIIGSDMILTLIEPDLDLDSSQNETYDLDLIKWSSSAATVTMGDADGEIDKFDPEPLSFRETGPSTGIFQIVIEIPQELDRSSLQRGEEIDLEYTDWGPSGADYVGDQDEDIRLTVFTSNFGATIDLDQKVYSWTDKVYITVVAPDHNFDDNLIDEIGETDEDPLRVATKGYDLDNYRLVETGFDTGIFTGEVILTGFRHDPTGDGNYVIPRTIGNGPTDGYLQTPSDSGISVSYEFSEDETVFSSSIIRWNIGDVQWLEASYPASATGVLRVIDPDMNLNPEAVDNFDVNIASNTDASGITLTVTETNEATGIFEGTIFFTTTSGSSGHRLRVSEGDTVTADYADGTLPLPYTVNDSVSITSTTIIGTIVPPLERAPATSLRIVDTFGSSIDAVSIDQQVQITADLSNGQDRDQDFAYLIQIQNSEGVTVSLSWIAGSLSPGQSFSPSASWTPTSAGTYTVTAFVWESIDNPTALSPPLTIDVSVN